MSVSPVLYLFLQRNLGDTYRGGIGSYLLFCMCLLYIHLTPCLFCPQLQRRTLLSHLFLEFLHFYGLQWDVEAWGGWYVLLMLLLLLVLMLPLPILHRIVFLPIPLLYC